MRSLFHPVSAAACDAWLLAVALLALLALTAAPAAGQAGFPACVSATGSCFEVRLDEPGCNSADCCTTVCTIEPACCSTGWDDLCVAIAEKFCSACGTATNSCFAAGTTPGCNSPECCSFVCSVDPACCATQWDESCVKRARAECRGCGAPGAGDCLVVHEGFGCADSTCCERVCLTDPNCCSQTWDLACTQLAALYCLDCGGPLSGSCCHAQLTPFCNDPLCCDRVCNIDPYCCNTRWDVACVELANTECNLWNCRCGDPAAGDCRSAHGNPGCSDFDCCNAVCLLDPWCCTVSWDYSCINIASQECTTNPACGDAGSGSCYVRHQNPGCDDAGCCDRVCEVDPLCCEITWDDDCVRFAEEVCTRCGDVLAGSCFAPHAESACANYLCCEAVCKVDPFCCSLEWDSLCVTIAEAQAICGDPINSCGGLGRRNCFVAGTLPGCSDASCCLAVCTVDPWCCEVRWDAACAQLAIDDDGTACGGLPVCQPGGGGRGSCITAHLPYRGCNDPLCCNAVCTIEPACCTIGWDQYCADYAKTVCFGLDNCPGVETCFRSHGSPGCEDPSCCNVVCAVDPACCVERWDSNCVSIANTRCEATADQPCPCIGSCFKPHENGGCDDPACCAGVCFAMPECCEVAWDQACVNLARITCCGDVACGNACSGTCFEPHDQPYCNDPACCEAVCAIDPFCCGNRWDSSCAAAANIRCRGLCGIPGSGSCFVPHQIPACSDRNCCAAVCAVDPLCCEASWDDCCVALATGEPAAGCNLPKGKPLCTPPECGDWTAGRCCEANGSPRCDNAECCEAVCAKDPFCCDTDWDLNCVSLARDENACGCVSECGDECAGSCCEARDTPYCNDAGCCDAVCAVDPACCDFAWDTFCVTQVYLTTECSNASGPCPIAQCGDADAGDCCSPHGGPACSDESCCDDVCAIDNFCCTIQWDVTCAAIALNTCDVCEGGLSCGSPAAGSCFSTHSTPFCDNFSCCTTVCIIDKACCSASWDQDCVQLAQQVCGGGG